MGMESRYRDSRVKWTTRRNTDYWSNNVYSGSTCLAMAVLESGEMVSFGSVQILSVSDHRDASRVLPLGVRKPRGFTFGADITAGSLAFTMIDQDVMEDVITAYLNSINSKQRLRSSLMLPPFNLMVMFDKGDADFESDHTLILEDVSFVDTATSLGVSRPTIGQEYAFVCTGTSRIMPNEPLKQYDAQSVVMSRFWNTGAERDIVVGNGVTGYDTRFA